VKILIFQEIKAKSEKVAKAIYFRQALESQIYKAKVFQVLFCPSCGSLIFVPSISKFAVCHYNHGRFFFCFLLLFFPIAPQDD